MYISISYHNSWDDWVVSLQETCELMQHRWEPYSLGGKRLYSNLYANCVTASASAKEIYTCKDTFRKERRYRTWNSYICNLCRSEDLQSRRIKLDCLSNVILPDFCEILFFNSLHKYPPYFRSFPPAAGIYFNYPAHYDKHHFNWLCLDVRGVSGKYRSITCRPIGKFLMLIMATLPSTLNLYLWAVLVWQW